MIICSFTPHNCVQAKAAASSVLKARLCSIRARGESGLPPCGPPFRPRLREFPSDCLSEEVVLFPETQTTLTLSIYFGGLGSGGDEDIQTYLKYYADGRARVKWGHDWAGDKNLSSYFAMISTDNIMRNECEAFSCPRSPASNLRLAIIEP